MEKKIIKQKIILIESKLKIALTIPPYSFRETYPKFMFRTKKLGKGRGAIPGATAPLGTLYIAAILKNLGHDVFFLDGVFHPKEDEWIQKIKEFDPDFIGINSVSVLWEKTKELSKRLKKEIPGVYIGVAGSHVTGIGPSILKERGTEEIDFIFLGESEDTVKKFLKALLNNNIGNLEKQEPSWSPSDVWNTSTICWKEKENIKMLKKQQPPQDLDKLPLPAREISPMEKYCPSISFYKRRPHATMWTSRGCVFNCDFCTSKRNYRERSVDSVIEEIKHLIEQYNVKDIFFYDNNIAYNKKKLRKICTRLINEDLDLIWSAQTRVTDVNKNLLKLMKKAGCWRLCYGIETPSAEFLKKLKKGISANSTLKAINLTKEIGIEVFGAFILGMPGEKIEDMKRTINFACSLPLDYAKFNIFTPFPDSRGFKSLKKTGKQISQKFTQHHVTFEFEEPKKEEIEKVFKEAYIKFYSRPSYLLKRILSMRSLFDLESNFRGSISFLIENIKKVPFVH